MSTSYIIQIFLPFSPDTQPRFDGVRAELTDRFGGVTFYRNSPAEGLWKDDGKVERDIMVLPKSWWRRWMMPGGEVIALGLSSTSNRMRS